MVLSACTGKNDKAATIKMTANVITPNVAVSVFNVPALSGINFFLARIPAMATCPTMWFHIASGSSRDSQVC